MRRTVFSALLFFVLLSAVPVFAQGCTQCRDNTAATPPATQRAYRHAIVLMAGVACGLFVTTIALLKRSQ